MKIASFCFFILSSIAMLWIVSGGVVRSDIFSLIDSRDSRDSKNVKILQIAQQNIARNIAFLSTNPTLLESLKNNDFESLYVRRNLDLELLESLKIASLNYEVYLQIMQNPIAFFKQSAHNFLNPFLLRFFSRDLLNLSGHSSLLKQNQFELDLESGMIFIEFEGKKYYFANARLSPHYDAKSLLNTIAEAKAWLGENEEFLAMGNEILASEAKVQGNKEGLIFSTISIFCITALMYFSFHSWHILKLLLVVLYSFLSGIAAAFLIFKEIHLLSIVASVSLIGLVLDFALHWLGDNINAQISQNSILKFTKVFLSGLVITSGGYGFFLFSKMEFLQQIAVISMFGLLGAFLITFFLLPFLLCNVRLRAHKRFLYFIDSTLIFYQKTFPNLKKLAPLLCLFIILTFVIFLPKQDFNDDVKSYSAISQNLQDDMDRFLKIAQSTYKSNFLILNSNGEDLILKERALMGILKDRNLILDYDGISKLFLSEAEQNNIKEVLQTHKNALIEAFSKIGINKDSINNYLLTLQALPTLNIEAISDKNVSSNIIHTFLADKNTSIIFLKEPRTNAEFYEILESFNAHFIDQSEKISQYFTNAKKNAIFLKLYALFFAFLVLWILFNFRDSIRMIAMIALSSLLSLSILLLCGVGLNIFSIFGLILASSIGVDYVIFATNRGILQEKRIFGIMLANLTSIISFFALSFSQSYALFSFGVSVSLCLALCAFFALSLVVD